MYSPKELRSLFSYHPEGYLIRRRTFARCNFVGEIVRGTTKNRARPYRTLKIFKRTFYMHRIIWAVVHGRHPRKLIDHINRDKSDNRIENLREADHRQNGYNTKINTRNKTGHRNINYRPHLKSKPWRVRLSGPSGKEIFVGHFSSKAAAVRAQKQAVARLHGEFKSITSQV